MARAFQRFLVDANMYLAPNPAFWAAMPAGVPLAFTLGFDARAIDQQVQRAGAATIGQAHVQGVLAAAQSAEVWHHQSKPMSRNKLCTKPVVCRSGIPSSTFSVRHAWIAASLKLCCRPRLPLGGGTQTISGSNQIDSDPRRFRLAL